MKRDQLQNRRDRFTITDHRPGRFNANESKNQKPFLGFFHNDNQGSQDFTTNSIPCRNTLLSARHGLEKKRMMRAARARPHTAFNPATSKYNVACDGRTIETTVTDKGTVVDQWIQETLSRHAESPTVVGLDIEWRPNVTRWMSNRTATLQLCIDKRCLIVQLFYIERIPESLEDFLGNPSFTFVGVEIDGDVGKLRVEYGLECAAHKDARELAKMRWPGRFRKPGLKDLALEVAGLVMDKPKYLSTSDWQARVLNMNQVEYACIDAYASYKLGTELL